MKIVILHREYPPNTVFVSTSLLYQRMAKAFVNRGHEVHVICQSSGRPIDRDDDGVYVHEIGSNLNRGSARARASYSYAAWRKLRHLSGIDVVNAEFFLAEGLLYSLSKRDTPLVLQTHAWSEGWLDSTSVLGSAERRMSAYLEKVAARRADKVIATSKATYQWLLDKVGLPESHIRIVYEFVDTATYKPAKSDLRVRLGIPDDFRLVLFVASLEPRKGPKILADAIPQVLTQVPKTKFLFVGRDIDLAPGRTSMKSYIEQVAEKGKFKNNIIFTGVLPISDVVEAYSACDLFVYPGLIEAGGLPPLEAMACDCPVIATATGTSDELAGVSPAFQVVPPGDSKALAKKIIELLSMQPQTLRQLAAKHRAIVEDRFNFDKMVNLLLSVYEEVMS